MLAIILIASLLLSDVEDKTFEYGMLRTLGMHKSSLVLLVIIQVRDLANLPFIFLISVVGLLFGSWSLAWANVFLFGLRSHCLLLVLLHRYNH
jgi:ABC-type antimicrobial peptide transport system permease subunit